MNITRLRIPTGGRQTSWLFTSVAEKLNSGLREQHQLAVRTGFEPTSYGFQIRHSNHSATLPPLSLTRIPSPSILMICIPDPRSLLGGHGACSLSY